MILVNGDSFTYGEESSIAWANLIPNTVNIAESGYSNDAIVRTTVNSIESCLLSVEYVIVAWTTPNRIEVNGQHLTPHSHRKYGSICDYVFLDWNEQWANSKFNTQVLLLDAHIKSKNIPYVFIRTFDVPDTTAGNWMPGSIVEWMGDCPKGPGGHPLELGQVRIAEHVEKYIRNLGWLP